MCADRKPPPNLRALLVEWAPAMGRVAASYVAEEEREDLTQDILLAIWESLPSFRDESSMRTFVYRIAHNRAIDFTRKRARRPPMGTTDQLVSSEPAADRVAHALCQKRRLIAAIGALPLTYRQPLTMHLEGLSYAEIAEVLAITENNVAVRIHRARQSLQEALSQEEKS